MPVFDLKNATILIKDGNSQTGAINMMAGYVVGTTTMTVDGFAVAPPLGATFTVDGLPQRYKITASSTTSLTFTPGLTTAGVDNDVILVGGRQTEMKMGDGTITVKETKNREYILNRGRIGEVRDGDEAPLEVSMDAQLQFITGHSSDPGGQPTLKDALRGTGLASAWVSSDTEDPCRPYAVDIEILYEPICETVYGESIVLPDFRYESLDFDFKAGTISMSGKCNSLEIESTRFDQEV